MSQRSHFHRGARPLPPFALGISVREPIAPLRATVTAAAAAVVAMITLAACAMRSPLPAAPAPTAPVSAPMTAHFRTAEFADVAGWLDDAVERVAPAITKQCALPSVPAPWLDLCASFATRGSLAMRAWLEREFQPWQIEARATDGAVSDVGLVTGYYEALLNGSRLRGGAFQTPLHHVPPDLLTVDLREVAPATAALRLRGRISGTRVVPYHDRRAIDEGSALAGQELLWVDDPVDAFFLQIQGSGRVRLRDGSMVAVRYADQNGHPYRAIGRTLIDQGLLSREQADAPGIKAWLRAHPESAREIMAANPSYVFFREQPAPADEDQGPPGSLGVSLTPQRSLAVDPAYIPLGTLVFVDTVHPIDNGPLAVLAVAQDTGGAIRGPVRADLFWGLGESAETSAGRMRSNGRLWMLWPRHVPLPGSGSR